MARTIPTTEPTEFMAGNTVDWTKTLADFPASDGWTVTHAFVNSAGTFTTTSTADGDDHLTTITAAISADISAGDYRWQAYATKGAERYPAGSGATTVKANFATGATDGRGHAKTVLDALEAVMENRASSDQASVSIGGRSISKLSPAELIEFISFYRREYASEVKAERIAAGLGHRGKVRVRFLD